MRAGLKMPRKSPFPAPLPNSDWNNVHLKRDAKDILALKQAEGGSLLIFGSPGLVKSFQAIDAIDEYWMFLNPVLLGEGIRFFHDPHKPRFHIADSKRFDPDVIRIRYVRRES